MVIGIKYFSSAIKDAHQVMAIFIQRNIQYRHLITALHGDLFQQLYIPLDTGDQLVCLCLFPALFLAQL